MPAALEDAFRASSAIKCVCVGNKRRRNERTIESRSTVLSSPEASARYCKADFGEEALEGGDVVAERAAVQPSIPGILDGAVVAVVDVLDLGRMQSLVLWRK